MNDDLIDEIKRHFPMVEFARRYLPEMKREGRSYRALCCFHREKSPSLIVHSGQASRPDTFHCFGCNAGGDVIDFAMAAEGWSKGEAIHRLAEEAGLDTGQAQLRREQRDHMKDLAAQADHWIKGLRAFALEMRDEALAEMGDEEPLVAFETYDEKGKRFPVAYGTWNSEAVDNVETYSSIIRWIDGLKREERGQLFLDQRSGRDLKAWRRWEAGKPQRDLHASERAAYIREMLSAGIERAKRGGYKDPDDFIRRFGGEAYRDSIENATEIPGDFESEDAWGRKQRRQISSAPSGR